MTKHQWFVGAMATSLAIFSGCVEQGEGEGDDVMQSPQQALTPPTSPTLSGDDVEISRGDASVILAAVKAHDVHALNRLLPDLYQVNSVVQTIVQGPLADKAQLSSPAYFRHSKSPALQLLVADDAALSMQLWAVDGQLYDVSFTRTQVEGGWWLVSVDASALPDQGLLLLGPARHDLTSLDINVWALAVMDEPQRCDAAAAQCADDDLRCVFEAHSSCLDESLALYGQGGDAGQLLSAYVESKSDRFKQVSITQSADGSGAYELRWSGAGRPAHLYELLADGSQRELRWSLISAGVARLEPPATPLDPDSLIILSEASGLSSMGAVKVPETLNKAGGKTWTLQGCLQFRDDWLQAGSPNVPVREVDIEVSTSLALGIYSGWSSVRTDANGCFNASKTFHGPFKGSNRKVKVRMRLADAGFTMWNLMSVDGVLRGGFSEILDLGEQSFGGINIGNRLFAPGQAGLFGDQIKHRQVASFEAVRRFDDTLAQQDSWLGFNGFYHLNYPTSMSGAAITPPNPLNLLNPWGPAPFGHTMFLANDVWSMPTIIHESAHAWQYKHKSGNIPNIIPGFMGPIQVTTNGNTWPWQWTWNFSQWGTHNCQEDDNLAFLEGFAEYVSHEAFCGAVFNSPLCQVWDANPQELDDLENSWACINEGQPLLSDEQRVVHNDDGVTHGLKLLTADHHYRRDYNNIPASWPLNYVAHVFPNIALDKSCRWGQEDFDLFDVMLAFRAKPSAGLATNFPISSGNGLLQFYQRFEAIYQTHPNFLLERRPFLNPQTTINPWQQCFKRCTSPSSLWTGASVNASVGPGPNQCDVISVAPTTALSTAGRQWFASPVATCPMGSFDGVNCFVASPPAGTTAFIWMGGLYTSALPGNVCPLGSWDTANCYLGPAPTGTTAFVWMGNLYTTALMTCPIGTPNGAGLCYLGTSPVGTQAIITNTSTLSYLE